MLDHIGKLYTNSYSTYAGFVRLTNKNVNFRPRVNILKSGRSTHILNIRRQPVGIKQVNIYKAICSFEKVKRERGLAVTR